MMHPGGGGRSAPKHMHGFFSQQQQQPQHTTHFNTKKDVDVHVDQLARRNLSESERTLRYFGVARAYHSFREYALAKRFLQTYIDAHSTSPGLAEAYKLMGDILDDTNEAESALEQYKKSFEITPNRIALNRVCDLLYKGYGERETPETRKEWFTKQKTASAAGVADSRNSHSNPSDSFLNSSFGPGGSHSYFQPTFTPTSSPFQAKLYYKQNGGMEFQGTPQVHGGFQSSTPPQATQRDTFFRTFPTQPQLNGTPDSEPLIKHMDTKFAELMEKINGTRDSALLLKHMDTKFAELMEKINGTRDSALLLKHMDTKFAEVMEKIRGPFEKLAEQNFALMKILVEQNSSLVQIMADQNSIVMKRQEFNDHRFVAEMKNVPPAASSPSQVAVGEAKALPQLSQLFKPAEGSWTCNGCYLNNGAEMLKCPSCETMKEGVNARDIKTEEPKPSSQPFTLPQFSFGFKAGEGPLGFGSLAKKTDTGSGTFSFGGPATSTSSLFSSPVLPIFGTKTQTPTPRTSAPVEDGEDAAEEFVPTAEFAPVIPLPPLVQVKKGDEDENTIYEVRAKLLRLWEDKETGAKEWKERGVGNIKILQNKEQKIQVRIVMWREQIHKLACNHRITGDTEVTFFNNSDKALMWSARDFAAEDEPTDEIFVLKFGKPEQCKEFKGHVDRFAAEIKNEPHSASSPSQVAVGEPKSLPQLSQLFKKVEGTWTCSGCYLSNGPEMLKCPSCETLKEGVNPSDLKTEEPKPSSQPLAFPSFSFGFKAGGEGPIGFGDLAKKTGNGSGTFSFGGPATSTTTLFSSPVLPIFGTKTHTPTATAAPVEAHEEGAEEFVPTAEFAPVIPLPPLVQVKKGDEGENTIYEVRAKLLRLHTDSTTGTKEWKERGIGNIKILQDKERKTQVRIVMWREQIHKLACNHRITGDTEVTFFNNSDKALKWSAHDFAAEDEPTDEIFVLKFGKPEQCKEFKGHMDRLVAEIRNSPTEEPSGSSPSTTPTVGDTKETTHPTPLSQLFKKVEGSWTCNGCYLSNGPEMLKCPSCETLKEGVNPSDIKTEEPKPSTQPLALPSFSFGFKAGGEGPLGFGDLAKKTENGSGTFSFGGPATSSTSLFSSPVLPIFGTKTQTPTVAAASTEDGEDAAEEFVPTAEFAPVIPLPPLVQVKKGDEGENTIYEVRAKLFRLHTDSTAGTKEWKERGVGNIKILQNKEQKIQVRIVMWREQIHKLACNHRITGDTEVTFFNNSDKALMWSARDFAADDEPTDEIFVLKFGKPEQCKEFKGHVDRFAAEIKNEPPPASSPSPVAVGAAKSLPELSQLFKPAEGCWTCSGCYLNNGPEMLKCPSCETMKEGVNARDIKTEEEGHDPPPSPSSCPGCIGCEADGFDFGPLEKRQVPVYPEQTKTPEEYAEHLAEEKLANFSFSMPNVSSGLVGSPSTFNSPAGISASPQFSGFNSSNSFFSSTSLSPSKPGQNASPQVVDFGKTGGSINFTFGIPTTTSPNVEGSPQLSSPEDPAGEEGEDEDDYEDYEDDEEYDDEGEYDEEEEEEA